MTTAHTIQSLWAACLDDPHDDFRRGTLADLLEEHGFTDLAEAFRGPAGRALVRAAAEPPRGDLVLRLYAMTNEEREEEIHSWIEQTVHEALRSELAASAIAQTNARGWAVDGFAVESTAFDEDGCHVRITFTASGYQDANRAWHGNQMRGTAEAVIDAAGHVTYDVEEAEIDHGAD